MKDDHGNVRSNAFYTLKRFRGAFFLTNNSYDLFILQELFNLANIEKDKKIRMNLLRSIVEMKCIALEHKAKIKGMLDEYFEIMDCADKETKGRYEKPQTKFQVLGEQLVRNLLESNEENIK